MLAEDRQAIQQVLAGNPAAYADLVDRYQRRLLGLLSHAGGDRDLAEDIAQEAFTRAYQKLSQFSGESHFYTWLTRIALNSLASHHRKRRLENQLQREGFERAIDTVADGGAPDARMQKAETQRCVREAIALLDHERRIVLLLRDFDGMDYDQIAQTLDVPIGTVRSRLHRARLEVKSILQQRLFSSGSN